MVRTITKEEVLKTIRERGNLDSETEDMSLSELRQLHQVLFERAVIAGREELGDRFDITVLKGRLDNTFEHMMENMCPNSIDFCNRKNCDNYDPDCVARKMKKQMKRLISEILRPSSVGPWTRSRAMW
jgi:hypothetical protein